MRKLTELASCNIAAIKSNQLQPSNYIHGNHQGRNYVMFHVKGKVTCLKSINWIRLYESDFSIQSNPKQSYHLIKCLKVFLNVSINIFLSPPLILEMPITFKLSPSPIVLHL